MTVSRWIGIAGSMAAVALAAPAPSAFAQGRSAGMTVGVTVVRSCSVATPVAAVGQADAVRVSCGRQPSTAVLSSGALLPVDGAPAAAAIAATPTERGLVVTIQF